MVTKGPVNHLQFRSTITKLSKEPGESQAEFNSTKDKATFEWEGDTHTLLFDGKTDEVVRNQLSSAVGDEWINDFKELHGKAEDIRRACKAVENPNADIWDILVNFGDKLGWMVSKIRCNEDVTKFTDRHRLQPPMGVHYNEIEVDDTDAGLLVTLKTDPKGSKLGHSMTGIFNDDGTITTLSESISLKSKYANDLYLDLPPELLEK